MLNLPFNVFSRGPSAELYFSSLAPTRHTFAHRKIVFSLSNQESGAASPSSGIEIGQCPLRVFGTDAVHKQQ